MGGKRSRVISITVSNPTKTNGSALTQQLTTRVNCVCISANTVFHAVNLCTLHGNISPGSGTTIGALLPRVNLQISYVSKRRRVCLGNRSIDATVHARRTNVTTSTINTGPRIHTFLLRLRHNVAGARGILVSNQSVNAIILPSTAIGVFLATTPRTQTEQH